MFSHKCKPRIHVSFETDILDFLHICESRICFVFVLFVCLLVFL